MPTVATSGFWRSVNATVASIAEHDPAEADAYRASIAEHDPAEADACRASIEIATPVVRALLASVRAGASATGRARAGWQLAQALRRDGQGLVRDLLGSYGAMLRRRLPSDLTRVPVVAFAAHGAVEPSGPGGVIYGFWQAAYHLGQWNAAGGSQALSDALVRRLEGLGGQVQTSTPVTGNKTAAGEVVTVLTAGGERIPTGCVVAAIDPTVTVFSHLDRPLRCDVAADLRAVRSANAVQGVVHVAARVLPPYPPGRPEDFAGLQSCYVDRLDTLDAGWAAAEADRMGRPPGRLRGHRPRHREGPRTRFQRQCRRHLRLDPGPCGRGRALARCPSRAPRHGPRPGQPLPPHPCLGVASHPRRRAVSERGGDHPERGHRRHPGPPSRPGGPRRHPTGPAMTESHPDTWRGWRQALKVVSRPAHLRHTAATALIVGTVLFAINQLNVVVAGHATTAVWLKTGLTYLVPFAVSNIGILIATRR